jgi:hypothetical protein
MKTLKRLARILIYPQTVMREILDSRPDRMVIPFVVLVMVSGVFGDFNRKEFNNLPHTSPQVVAIMCVAAIAVMALLVLLFYGVAWVVALVGRLFEGQAKAGEVRSALAWGAAPIIWALLYRVPAALLLPQVDVQKIDFGDRAFRINPSQFSHGCVVGLIFGLLELGVLVWYLVVASRTLAEAHRFSAWRGLATLLLVGAAPFIIIIAAILAAK